jgi:O-antigen ligase
MNTAKTSHREAGSSVATWREIGLPEGAWLAAAALVALAFNPFSLNPFAVPKSSLLLALTLAIVFAAMARMFRSNSTPEESVAAPVRLAALLALTVFLSSMQSVDPALSLTGSLERQQGLPVQLAWLVLFVAVALGARSADRLRRLLLALVLGSVPVVCYALVQWLGLDPLDWYSDSPSPLLSTLGRSNFLASYLVMLLPLTFSLLMIWRREAPGRHWRLLGLGLLLLAQFICLLATMTRSAWIALAALVLVFALVHYWLFGKRRLLLAGIGMLLLAVVLLLVPRLPGISPERVESVPVFGHVAGLGQFEQGSTAARLTIWKFTAALVRQRPWLGYGPETFHDVFAEIYPPQLVYYHGREVTVDRAHNLWLDLAMSSGVVAVVLFVLLLVAVLRLAGRALKDKPHDWRGCLWAGVLAALAGFLVDQQFSFASIDVGVVFWLLLAMAVALAGLKPAQPRMAQGSVAGQPGAAGRIALIALYLLMLTLICLRPLLADSLAWHSMQREPGDVRSLELAGDAVWLAPRQSAYRLHLAWLHLSRAEFEAADREMRTLLRTRPSDQRVVATAAEFYSHWSLTEPAVLGEAERAWRQALELAPLIARQHLGLGLVLARQGRLDEAIAAVERTVDLDDTDGLAMAHLAELYSAAGRADDAEAARRRAIELGVDWPH